MRWLYLRTNPEHNVNFGYRVLDEIRRLFVIKLWNVYGFFVTYANLYRFESKKNINHFKASNVLDKWIISRLFTTIKFVKTSIESYDSTQAMTAVELFVENLSNWYVRRTRERISKNEDLEDRNQALETLWSVLTEYAKVLAPFTPFIADEIFTNLTGAESVHLESWPKIRSEYINQELEKEMERAMEVASVIQMRRKLNNIPVAIPLKRISYTGPHKLDTEIEIVVREETNVEELKYEGYADNFSSFGESRDLEKEYTDLKNRNEEAGQARKIIRKIQQQRKNLGVNLDKEVKVVLKDWPREYEEEIKRRALVRSITKGEDFLVVPT
ncbi:MAG: class I tRNA ligase family protein [Patescibacteria group bacterium]|nr:class I tRNA ligase family protein [Patescibacteria group bacterium]